MADCDGFGAPSCSTPWRLIATNDTTLCVHAENNEIVQELSAQAQKENPLVPMTHVITRPSVSESLGVLIANLPAVPDVHEGAT